MKELIVYGEVLNNKKKQIRNLKKNINIFSVLIDDIYGNTCSGKRRYESTSVLRFRCPPEVKPALKEGEKVMIIVKGVGLISTG